MGWLAPIFDDLSSGNRDERVLHIYKFDQKDPYWNCKFVGWMLVYWGENSSVGNRDAGVQSCREHLSR